MIVSISHKEFREACRQHTAKALETLVACLKSKNESIRMAAANSLIDRGWGKPAQTLQGPDGDALAVNFSIDLSAAAVPKGQQTMASQMIQALPPVFPPKLAAGSLVQPSETPKGSE